MSSILKMEGVPMCGSIRKNLGLAAPGGFSAGTSSTLSVLCCLANHTRYVVQGDELNSGFGKGESALETHKSTGKEVTLPDPLGASFRLWTTLTI
jgi:hypothetical protein